MHTNQRRCLDRHHHSPYRSSSDRRYRCFTHPLCCPCHVFAYPNHRTLLITMPHLCIVLHTLPNIKSSTTLMTSIPSLQTISTTLISTTYYSNHIAMPNNQTTKQTDQVALKIHLHKPNHFLRISDLEAMSNPQPSGIMCCKCGRMNYAPINTPNLYIPPAPICSECKHVSFSIFFEA